MQLNKQDSSLIPSFPVINRSNILLDLMRISVLFGFDFYENCTKHNETTINHASYFSCSKYSEIQELNTSVAISC